MRQSLIEGSAAGIWMASCSLYGSLVSMAYQWLLITSDFPQLCRKIFPSQPHLWRQSLSWRFHFPNFRYHDGGKRFLQMPETRKIKFIFAHDIRTWIYLFIRPDEADKGFELNCLKSDTENPLLTMNTRAAAYFLYGPHMPLVTPSHKRRIINLSDTINLSQLPLQRPMKKVVTVVFN